MKRLKFKKDFYGDFVDVNINGRLIKFPIETIFYIRYTVIESSLHVYYDNELTYICNADYITSGSYNFIKDTNYPNKGVLRDKRTNRICNIIPN